VLACLVGWYYKSWCVVVPKGRREKVGDGWSCGREDSRKDNGDDRVEAVYYSTKSRRVRDGDDVEVASGVPKEGLVAIDRGCTRDNRSTGYPEKVEAGTRRSGLEEEVHGGRREEKRVTG
jgi:hypothetical protein